MIDFTVFIETVMSKMIHTIYEQSMEKPLSGITKVKQTSPSPAGFLHISTGILAQSFFLDNFRILSLEGVLYHDSG